MNIKLGALIAEYVHRRVMDMNDPRLKEIEAILDKFEVDVDDRIRDLETHNEADPFS